MTADAVERDVQRTAAKWAFILSSEGQRAVSLDEFLTEVQKILQDKGLL